MTLRIRIDHGQDAGKVWRLAKEGVYMLGRVPTVPLQVLDMKVSKEHCRVIVVGSGDGSRTFLEDLGSTHGSLLNAQPVNGRMRLKPGDEIRVGLSILRVLSDGPADVEPEPSAADAPVAGAGEAEGGGPQARRTLAPDALVGREMGGYKVLAKIGQGGMGSVYVAEQLSLHREVAFKVLSEKFTSDSNFVDQFVNEARSAAALNHPNVVQVYDVGHEEGRYYFSMEYVSGGSIEEQLEANGPADWRNALNWMIDAANALIFANKRGILHRDVKPDNLMLAEDGSAKLCDLGLAKKAANEDMLAAGIIGTPAFISPEAIRRKKDIDGRSDLYSLGCTFYRILTGENPYPGKTVKDILMGHLKGEVPRVMRKRPEVPAQLDEVIERLMRKEPEDRYESAQDLLQALDKIRIQHGLEKHGLRPASRKPLVIALVLVVLLGGGALAYLLSQDPQTVEVVDEGALLAARQAEEAQRAAELVAFVADRGKDQIELEKKRLQGRLEEGDNWSDPSWPGLVRDFQALAARIEGHEAYADNEELQAIAKKAREDAGEIQEYVDLRRSLDKEIKTAREKALTEFEEALATRRKQIQEALDAKAWVQAATLAYADDLEALVRPFREMTVESILSNSIPQKTRSRFEGTKLLDTEKQVTPRVAEAFPGDPAGQALVDAAAAGAERAHKELLAKVTGWLAENTHQRYREAAEALSGYLETLPRTVDPKAGPLVAAYPGFRREAEALRAKAEKGDKDLLVDDLIHDRAAWCTLVRALRAPGEGHLFKLNLDEAEKMTRAAALTMRHPAYAEMAAQLQEDVGALRHLMGRLVSTFAEGWTKDRVSWTDDRGRDQSEKVREVTDKGLKIGNDTFRYEALGPAWLLRHVFFDDAASLKDARFPFEGEDHRGLALLGELAVEYDLVKRSLQAYAAWLPADRTKTQIAVRKRLGGEELDHEQAVGQAWRLAASAWRDVRAARNTIDPKVIGDEAFWSDERARQQFANEQGPALQQRVKDAMAALKRLRETGAWARTVWATALRSSPRLDLAYASEPSVGIPGPGNGPRPGDGPGGGGDGAEK